MLSLALLAIVSTTPESPSCGDGAEALALAAKVLKAPEPENPRRPCEEFADTQQVRLKPVQLTAGGIEFRVIATVLGRRGSWSLVPFSSSADAEAMAKRLLDHPLMKRAARGGAINCVASTNSPGDITWVLCSPQPIDAFTLPPTSGNLNGKSDAVEFSWVADWKDKACDAFQLANYSLEAEVLADGDLGWALVRALPEVVKFRAEHPKFRVTVTRWHDWQVKLSDGDAALTIPLEARSKHWCAPPARVGKKKGR